MRSLTRTPWNTAFALPALAALLAYIALLSLGPALTAEWLGHLNAHGHAHLHVHGHPFADARRWLGIPNAADVLSNLPFALLALWGGWRRESSAAECVLRLGLLATALGSGAYHAGPSPETLALDRGGMALAFAGLLALAVQTRVGAAEARVLLGMLSPLALLAAALPLAGNLMPWLLVQFGGVLALLALALRPTLAGQPRLPLGGIVLLYALAKVCEAQDAAVFGWTGGWLAGHTLKHLVAAAAAGLAVHALNPRTQSRCRSVKRHQSRVKGWRR